MYIMTFILSETWDVKQTHFYFGTLELPFRGVDALGEGAIGGWKGKRGRLTRVNTQNGQLGRGGGCKQKKKASKVHFWGSLSLLS